MTKIDIKGLEMEKITLIVFVILTFCEQLHSKPNLSLSIYDMKDTCSEKQIVLIDINSDNIFDILFYSGCRKTVAYSLDVNSLNDINEGEAAYLIDGVIESKNFTILIYDPNSFSYTHKLYFNSQISKAVLEDYTEQSSEHITYEESDNYFYIQQMGSTLLITKKAVLDVQSVLLCSLDGRIISNLQNVEGWSQFSFDLSFEPSGMYLLRFIARDKAMTKRVVYVR